MTIKELLKRVVFRLRGETPLEELKKLGLKVGRNFSAQAGYNLDPSHCWLITIGDDVTLAPRVQILAHDASTCRVLGYAKIGRVIIGNDVFIGAGSIVLPGVTIGDHVIIGAGSVVSHDIHSNGVYAGNPARFICPMEEYIQKHRMNMACRPVFCEEYTLRGNITAEKKEQQYEALADGIGYVK